jgi:hypothetical protein
MKRTVKHLLLVHCVGSYIGFVLFFALTPLWWSFPDMWKQLGPALPIYGLLAPISMPMLAVAPIALPPGPGIHACIFWLIYLLSLIGTYKLFPTPLANRPQKSN